MAFILDKTNFAKTEIKIRRTEKTIPYEEYIKSIEISSIIENFISQFSFEGDRLLIISEKYILSQRPYQQYDYENVSSTIITIVPHDLDKILIQTSDYIVIFFCFRGSFEKYKFKIKYENIGVVKKIILLEIQKDKKILVISTDKGCYYIEKNSLKKEPALIFLCDNIFVPRISFISDDMFESSIIKNNKTIKTTHTRYIYNKLEGYKFFNIKNKETIEKEPEKNGIDYGEISITRLKNLLISNNAKVIKSININQLNDVLVLLETSEKYYIIIWGRDAPKFEDNMIGIDKNKKFLITEKPESFTICYYCEYWLNINTISRTEKNNKGEYKFQHYYYDNKINLSKILFSNTTEGGIIISSEENDSSIIIRNDSQEIYFTEKFNNLGKIYYCYMGNNTHKFYIFYNTIENNEKKYWLFTETEKKEVSPDFTLSEENIENLNKYTNMYAVVEI